MDMHHTDPARARFVNTIDIREAVKGHEVEVLSAVGIPWQGRGHITCPYADHGGKDDWRWDSRKSHAVCTCRNPHSIFDVVMAVEGVDFEAAKVRVAEIIGRSDLIGEPHQRMDAASLLNPPASNRDDRLVRNYLAH